MLDIKFSDTGYWRFNLYKTSATDIPSLADLYGCTDESATNYDPNALYNADCVYAPLDSSWSAVGVWQVSNMVVGDGLTQIWWTWDSSEGTCGSRFYYTPTSLGTSLTSLECVTKKQN